MNSEKVTLNQVELAIFEAIKAHDSEKLKNIIDMFYDHFLQVTNEHSVIIDCFKLQSLDCFKYIVEKVDYPTKNQELNKLDNYLDKVISAKRTALASMQLSTEDVTSKHVLMIEALDTEIAQVVIGKLLLSGLEPTITMFAFDVFLQAQSTSPLDYLPNAKNSIEKELCLKLISSECE